MVKNNDTDNRSSTGLGWDALDSVLDELLDAAPDHRDAILERVRADDESLAERARKLLELALNEHSLPQSLDNAAPELFTALAEQDVRAHIGERLGPYKIVEIVSRGGMGIVFRGERADGAFEQSVAIKLIPASIAGERARALFDRERQHLARLEHPNIARIIDAGVTKKDTPYYIMEFIDGTVIDKHVLETNASRREILAYFLQLCDAVAYCHRSLIVHGDIKPGNVMIADNRVRLLDFGIGRMLEETESSGSERPVHAYSPGFAAPEQQQGESATIQSDVYSLGTVLQSMFQNFESNSEPNRATRVPRDIAAIIDCCRSKNPAERYDSVGALRGDIRNYLNHYPVSVRLQTRRYRASRFVRRNKLLVGATAAILLALGTGLATALWQYDVARTQANRADQVNNFLTSLFERADPIVAGEREVTLREIVEEAAARLDTELEEAPEVRAELTQLIGNAYFGIGDYDKALELHEQALSQWRTHQTSSDTNVVMALNAVGADYAQRGEYGKAEALHHEAIEQLAAMELSDSTFAVDSWTHLGAALVQTNPQQAREAMLHAHQMNLLIRPDDKAALARSLGNVAVGYRAERNVEESARYHELAFAMAEANDERLAPEILTIRCNLALDYGTLGRNKQARDAQQSCIRLTVERFGADHPANVPNLNNLGALDIRMGRLVDAEHSYLEALRIAEKKLPPMSLERMAAEINYSVVLWHSGRSNQAEKNLHDLLARMERSVGAAHPAAGRVRSLLGRVILERGDGETSRRFIENSLQGLTPYWRSDALLWLAEASLSIGENKKAMALAEESLELRRSIPHFTDWQNAEAEYVLGRATSNRDLLDRAKATFQRTLPANHFRRNYL